MDLWLQSPQSDPSFGFWPRFVLGVLSTWRLSHLLASEDGPGNSLARLREWLGDSAIGGLMDCFGCISMWVAAPISLFIFRRLPELFFCWLALSGAAFLLEHMRSEPLVIERMSDTRASTNSTNSKEDSPHGVLR